MKTFKSRFGYHPCEYQVFRRLKTIHKWHYQTLKDYANWDRWDRKLPKNRVIRRWIRGEQGNKIGSEVIGPRHEPKVFSGLLFANDSWVADYQNARMPRQEKDVRLLQHSLEEINQMYFRLKTWVTEQGKKL